MNAVDNGPFRLEKMEESSKVSGISGELIIICMTVNTILILLSLFWKKVYSKMKDVVAKGSKFFPFRVYFFSEGTLYAWKQAENY